MPGWLERYEDRLAGEGRALSTIHDYTGVVVRLERWAEGRGCHAADLPPRLLVRYVEECVPATRASRVLFQTAMRGYWEVVGRGDGVWRLVRVPKGEEPLCRALEGGDARTLHRAARAWEEGPEGVGVLLGLQQGLRRAEIATLRWEGFDDHYAEMTFVGKGPKVGVLPVHPLVGERLCWWRGWEGTGEWSLTNARTRPGREWVFEGRTRRGHVHPNTVWTWVKRVGERVGVEVTTHQLRHTFGAEANDRTRDLRATQDLLRHSKVTTTQRYTRVRRERMRETLMAVDYEEES